MIYGTKCSAEDKREKNRVKAKVKQENKTENQYNRYDNIKVDE